MNNKKNKNYRYDNELGLYVLKRTSDNLKSNGLHTKYNYYGTIERDIPISIQDVINYLKILFSGDFKPITEKDKMRNKLKFSKFQFLEITTNLKKHVRKHNLDFYLKHLRESNKQNKRIVLNMKEGIK